MALWSVSVSASGPSGTGPAPGVLIPGPSGGIIFLPMKYQIWTPGVSCLVNFSGTGATEGGSAAGSGTVSVQVSNDPALQGATPTAARWNNHDTLYNLTADKNSSIVYPCYAVRLFCTSYSSGTITLMIGVTDYQT